RSEGADDTSAWQDRRSLPSPTRAHRCRAEDRHGPDATPRLRRGETRRIWASQSPVHARTRTAMNHGIAREYRTGRVWRMFSQSRIKRRKRLVRLGEELFETVDDEVGFLKRVDAKLG